MERGEQMTAIEYMEKQLEKHSRNYVIQSQRGVSEETLYNIALKIGYYTAAVEALKSRKIVV
jgi:hypothetical protein